MGEGVGERVGLKGEVEEVRGDEVRGNELMEGIVEKRGEDVGEGRGEDVGEGGGEDVGEGKGDDVGEGPSIQTFGICAWLKSQWRDDTFPRGLQVHTTKGGSTRYVAKLPSAGL